MSTISRSIKYHNAPAIWLMALFLFVLYPFQIFSYGLLNFQDSERPGNDPQIREIIREFSLKIPEQVKNQGIPGFAMAVVDPDTVIWMQAFGYTDDSHVLPVDEETIFSVQSISKTFTATAILHAVQEGILDLNLPVTHYLPEFSVNSAFEADPMATMTLKHLLSHKAGFTHEAPVGNNFDASFDSFEYHVRSISDTWLKFQVGERFSYSNLGIDLAGWILEKQSGMPFHEYVKKNILDPLGMQHSSFETDWIKENKNRAIGQSNIVPEQPVAIPIIPSGGFYASISDMTRFVRFHMNEGRAGNRQVLKPEWLDTMYAIPFAHPGQQFGYALGIDRWYMHASLLLNHGGGGFGFLSFMMWYPDHDFGIITLSNYDPNDLHRTLAFDLAEKILEHLNHRQGINDEPEPGAFPPPFEYPSPPVDYGPDKPEWRAYEGTYRITMFGQPVWKGSIRIKNGYLHYNGQPLKEHLPGLFFDPEGEALDMRGSIPTYRNLRLERIPFPEWVLGLAFCVAAGSISFLVGWPVFQVFTPKKARHKNHSSNKWPVIYLISGTFISLVLLAYLYLLMYEIPFALYESYPWYYRYPVYVKIILVMPLVVVVWSFYLLLSTYHVWYRKKGILQERVIFSLLASASVLFVMLLIHWNQFSPFF